jgi:phospholipid-binding lipoprotein MlaA
MPYKKKNYFVLIVTNFLVKFLVLFLILQNPADALGKSSYDEDSIEADFAKYSNNTPQINDPAEKFNRKIFAFNEAFDKYFFRYVAISYRKAIPKKARISVRNFLTNLTLPLSTVNSLLQGKIDNSLATFSSFLINSTIGIGGLFDPAGAKNIRYNHEDFLQTFAQYGASSGAYLVIPILGPSSTRDFSGFIVEKAVDPLGFNALSIGGKKGLITKGDSIGITVADAIDKRESMIEIIDEGRKDSFDFYAMVRSAYLQKISSEIQK